MTITNSDKSVQLLVQKYLLYQYKSTCLISDDNDELGLGVLASFRENRHDQSIFSLVRKLQGSVHLLVQTYLLY
jgi:hypothetical protein